MELPEDVLRIIRDFSRPRFTQYNALRILRPSRPPSCIVVLALNEYELALKQYHRSLILFNMGDEFDILQKEPKLHRAKQKLLHMYDT